MADRSPAVSRERHFYAVAEEEMTWVDACCLTGGPFATPGHAIEIALQRLQDQQRYLRGRCEAEGLAFDQGAFWDMFEPFRAASRPDHRERGRVRVPRRTIGASLDVRLVKLLGQLEGHHGFESTSHIVETSLRVLHSNETDRPFSGMGFPVDEKSLWKAYCKAAETTV